MTSYRKKIIEISEDHITPYYNEEKSGKNSSVNNFLLEDKRDNDYFLPILFLLFVFFIIYLTLKS